MTAIAAWMSPWILELVLLTFLISGCYKRSSIFRWMPRTTSSPTTLKLTFSIIHRSGMFHNPTSIHPVSNTAHDRPHLTHNFANVTFTCSLTTRVRGFEHVSRKRRQSAVRTRSRRSLSEGRHASSRAQPALFRHNLM